MSRSALLAAAAVALLLLCGAAPAGAATKTYRLHSGPVDIGGFATKLPKVRIPAPRVDGYVTGMQTRLVDRRGRRVSIRDVMLHHIVFLNDGDGRQRAMRGSCEGRFGEPFYGTGEEHQQLVLPRGYGYHVHRRDRWRMQTMLMSHSLRSERVYVQYDVTVVTGRRMRNVRPFWIRANGCASNHPSYTVEGGGPPGSTTTRTFHWKVPMTGRIVAATGHLHGGARNMTLDEPSCQNRTLFDTRPLYAPPDDIVYTLRPILHEPGPIATRHFLSEDGIPVRKGEILDLHGLYDGRYPRARVMSVMHLYIVPTGHLGPRCAPLPPDRRQFWLRTKGTTEPPYEPVPLNMLQPDGSIKAVDELPGPVTEVSGPTADVAVQGGRFTPSRISIPVGTRLTWRFGDAEAHNVLFASGPRVVGTPTRRRGQSDTRTFNLAGRYQLFCYLHPVTMQQEVIVR